MRRILISALIGTTAALGLLIVALRAGGMSRYPNSRPAKATIIFYTNGSSRTIKTAASNFTTLRNLIETAFSNSPNGLYEPESKGDLISPPGQAVEILYPKPEHLTVRLYDGERLPVNVDRILLKINGPHAGWSISGNGSYANAAPMITDSTTTLASIEAILSK
jgi:hypothetical protein